MNNIGAKRSLITLLAWASCASGCAMFRSPDPKDMPKSRYDVAQAAYDDPASDPSKSESKPLLDPETFSADGIKRNFKSLIGQGPDRELARENYEKGRTAYQEAGRLADGARFEKFLEAADFFSTAADRWPDSALEQDALFMAGECYFFAEHYVEANRKYEFLVKRYPNSRHLDVVEQRRFLVAKWWLDANDKSPYAFYQFNFIDESRPWYDHRGNALRLFDKIRVDDPTGKLSDDAALAAGHARFSRGEYERAGNYYTDLIKAYPDSEHQFDAHFFGLKAKLLSYRGSDYAGEALDEAEKLVKQMRRQFPHESAKEREFLDRSYAEIRYKKADREWKMASYYDRRGEFAGAKHYYDIVSREYDDTPFGEKAAVRAAELVGKPAVPPQRLGWLVKLFPESDELKPILEKSLIKTPEDSAGAIRQVSGTQP